MKYGTTIYNNLMTKDVIERGKKLMTKENFLKFYWEFYEEKKQIEWYENYILWQSIHPTKLRCQIWGKKI